MADLTRQALLVGAHTVLVVPPLPDREARQFGERVARVTQYARPTPAAVIALAREAWTLARRTAPPGAQERPEADVTVTASLSSRTLTFLPTSHVSTT